MPVIQNTQITVVTKIMLVTQLSLVFLVTQDTLVTLIKDYYIALIRRVINYGSVFSSDCDKERLVRVLTLQPRAPPSVALFIRLKWCRGACF